jgi:hypothetical protein
VAASSASGPHSGKAPYHSLIYIPVPIYRTYHCSDLGEGRQHQLRVVLDVGRLLECFLIVQTFKNIQNKNLENRRKNFRRKNGNLTLGRPGEAAH